MSHEEPTELVPFHDRRDGIRPFPFGERMPVRACRRWSRPHFALAPLIALVACADAKAPTQPQGVECGDGIAEGPERCDGEDLRAQSCRSLGGFRGRLACHADCTLDTRGCTLADPESEAAPVCGNGFVEGEEACDSDPPPFDCAALGEGEGPLSCTPACRLDLSRCCHARRETCDGADDDCDGAVDEDTCGAGEVCALGRCIDCIPGEEQCNATDDDCDGRIDEATCRAGESCTAGRCVDCQPTPERCNGRDDDCDERVDEGHDPGRPCVVGVGECRATGELVCDGRGMAAICSAQPRPGRSERCDGRDDDCDGAIDEGGADCGPGAACLDGDCLPAACVDPPPTRLVAFGANRSRVTGESSVRGSCGGDGPEVAYVFAVEGEGILCLDTVGSAIDTVLHVRRACADGETEVACNDDALGLHSQVELAVVPERTYTVFVDGFGRGGDIVLNVSPGRCAPACVAIDRCEALRPAEVVPDIGQSAANDDGLVMRLQIAEADDCDRLRFRVTKRDDSAFGVGTYTLRVGSCAPEAVVRARAQVDVPRAGIDFETDFRGEAGASKAFCVTKAADVPDPMGDETVWWFSNLARLTRVVERCP